MWLVGEDQGEDEDKGIKRGVEGRQRRRMSMKNCTFVDTEHLLMGKLWLANTNRLDGIR